MRILFVAATVPEVDGLVSKFKKATPTGGRYISADLQHTLIITGVGMVAAAFAIGHEHAKNHYDLAINLGIAGSFDRNIALGEVVEITSDTLAELGAQDDSSFLTINELGFGESVFKASKKLADIVDGIELRKATAITVNTVHGNELSIKKIIERLNPNMESMEGAAFFYACHQAKLPCIQIRAVSNYVEKRNRDTWQIGLAVKNLNTFALQLLHRLEV
ncbi:futalosine hydrolase [Mucilaginibacter segetis]|uniref:Futalosine hydrolase n=1 Tax=Mucilaginibacter segetis TaxID=2793071 RepID=A0A934UNT8_9SPHI|nr:futalosine hydrolase [Mucilaginibacter segetis]MBK0380241.1 futalosine hydrolase [Mucilaginibacter segetis]